MCSISAYASCTPYLVGATSQDKNQTITSKNSLVWTHSKSKWNVSKLLDSVDVKSLSCDKDAYVLVSNDEKSYKTPSYTKDSYSLKKGWNYLPSHKDGVDVVKTFKNLKDLEFVYVYDKRTAAWAAYSPVKNLEEMMSETRVLALKKIEPGIGFYVYAKKSMRVDIKHVKMSEACMKFINDDNFDTLIDSGTSDDATQNSTKSMAIQSRYFSHYRRGVYDESRVMLIYPKLKLKGTFAYKYGPASPKVMLKYAKEYEESAFYIYDFKDEQCYSGKFPSQKIPPFSSLKKLD